VFAVKKTAKSTGIFVVALACSLTLSACASPVAPAAKPANFYEAVRSDAEEFWADYFSSKLGRPYTPITRMQLFAGEVIACGGSQSGPFYCSPDRVVYLDTQVMETQLSDFGDFGAATIIAHEIGHHTQALRGLLGVPSIFKELQADCLAGGWMKDADARGLLEVSDSQEAAGSLFEAGDRFGIPWFDPTAHGTPQQRVEAFRIGFLQGVSSCEW
jgi:uncharacterized protein